MSGFSWIIDGEIVEIIFSLVRNGRWMIGPRTGQRVGVRFDYLEYEGIAIGLSELEDLGDDVSQMLLQVLNLEST
jgi:hypothetical protein